MPLVSLASFANICQNANAIILSGGSPSGGTYSGTGVTGNSFNPAAAGVGTATITYTYANASGCSATANKTIVVDPTPMVALSLPTSICINAAPLTLTGGTPAGGVYGGTGVANGMFNPASTGTGIKTII